MSSEDTINNCNSKMKKALDVFNHDLGSLRTGRANASMLDIIKVDVYGQSMSINQLANISTPEPRLLTVQVWDQNNVPLIDAAIKKSNLGINPQIDGQLMRIPIPTLTEERRKELKKIITSLVKKIQLPNNTFVHRDFHVSNLMINNKKIFIIDSQDAVYGNIAYDLASLIDDVRLQTSKNLKEIIRTIEKKDENISRINRGSLRPQYI